MKSEVFGPLNALSPEEYNAIYEKTQIDVDGRKQHLQFNKGTLDNMIKKYVNFSHAIPCFSDLPSQDQAKLLKGTNIAIECKKYGNFIGTSVVKKARNIKFHSSVNICVWLVIRFVFSL